MRPNDALQILERARQNKVSLYQETQASKKILQEVESGSAIRREAIKEKDRTIGLLKKQANELEKGIRRMRGGEEAEALKGKSLLNTQLQSRHEAILYESKVKKDLETLESGSKDRRKAIRTMDKQMTSLQKETGRLDTKIQKAQTSLEGTKTTPFPISFRRR